MAMNDAFGTQDVYLKSAPGICIEIDSGGETKIGTGY